MICNLGDPMSLGHPVGGCYVTGRHYVGKPFIMLLISLMISLMRYTRRTTYISWEISWEIWAFSHERYEHFSRDIRGGHCVRDDGKRSWHVIRDVCFSLYHPPSYCSFNSPSSFWSIPDVTEDLEAFSRIYIYSCANYLRVYLWVSLCVCRHVWLCVCAFANV